MAAAFPGSRIHPATSDFGQSRTRRAKNAINVGASERLVSGMAGSILVLQGLAQRNWKGLIVSGIGAALIQRGVTGHCGVYERLGESTSEREPSSLSVKNGIHVAKSMLVNRPADELYQAWSNLEQLPQMMTHLKSVTVLDDLRSRWVAKAPTLVGGEIEWEAETVQDVPGRQISWKSIPGSSVESAGRVKFQPALGSRGTNVIVQLDYSPPAGKLGHWIAGLFGENAEQQIHDDLRSFKHMIEVGEIPTAEGQPHGSCLGLGRLRQNS